MIEFFVSGQPATQGSKRPIAYTGKDSKVHARAIESNAKKHKSWRALVHDVATEAMGDRPPLECAIWLRLVFVRPRPKSHYRTGKRSGELRDSAPQYPTTRPDTVKLTRCVEDALTSIVWRDDSQVVQHALIKTYGKREGVLVQVEEMWK